MLRAAVSCILALGFSASAVPATAAPGIFESGAFPELSANGQSLDTAAADAVLADFNGDGRRDVFIAMGRTQGANGLEIAQPDRLYLGDAQSGFSLSALPFDAAFPRAASTAVAADFNRDGRLDLIVAGASVYLGPTPGVRIEPTVIYSGRADTILDGGVTLALGNAQPVVQLIAIDYDGDGASDLLLRDSNGLLRVLRNSGSAGGAIAFTEVQSIGLGSSDPRNRMVVGRFAGEDARPDLALLVPVSGTEPAGVVVYRNQAGALPYVREQSVALLAPLADLAAADFNLDGRDDLVVVADAEDVQAQWSRTRVLWAEASTWRIGSERFPGNGLRRVAVGDLDADGRADLVFGRVREAGASAIDVPSLLVALNRNAGFVPTEQCLGRYAGVPRSIQVGAVDGDAWPDLLVMGAAPQAAPRTGPGWWRNNAPELANACCMAELAAQHATSNAGTLSLRMLLGGASSAVSLGAYSGVRDQILAAAGNGPRILQRYASFSPEITQLMRNDPALWGEIATALSLWSEPVLRLLAGNGASRTVSTEMIDAVDAVLIALSNSGSAALAAAIADERARLPPFSSLVGLDMNAFRNQVAPIDRLHTNGFEANTP